MSTTREPRSARSRYIVIALSDLFHQCAEPAIMSGFGTGSLPLSSRRIFCGWATIQTWTFLVRAQFRSKESVMLMYSVSDSPGDLQCSNSFHGSITTPFGDSGNCSSQGSVVAITPAAEVPPSGHDRNE